LSLCQQLDVQQTLAVQSHHIRQAAAALAGGQAALWLCESLAQTDRDPTHDLAAQPLSPTMRQALETRQIVTKADPSGGRTRQGTSYVATLPLVTHDEVLGVLEVNSADSALLTDDTISLLNGLTVHAALVLHSSYMERLERQRLEQLALVGAVSAQIADILDLDELAVRVTDLIWDTFQYYYVALFILNESEGQLRCWASAGPRSQASDHAAPVRGLLVQMGEGIVGYVAQNGAEVLANDVEREPRYRYIDALSETHSEIAVPIAIESRVLGVLDVQSNRKDAFHKADQLVLSALADNIAIAVAHARLWHDLERRAGRLSAVTEVGRAVTSILDIDHLFEQVVTIIHEKFGYPFVHLYTVDPFQRQIAYRAGSGRLSDEMKALGLAYDLDSQKGIIPWAARTGETIVANDVLREPRYRPPELLPTETRAELVVPLVFGHEVLGVLDLQSDRPDAFEDEDKQLFETLADSVAVALRNANLYRSERWRRQVADSLREVAGLLSADVLLEEMLNTILVELEHTLPCDIAAIWLLEDDELSVAAVRGSAAAEDLDDLPANVELWLTQALQAQQPTIRVPNAARDPLQESLGFPADYSAIAAPLRAGTQPLGLLTLADRMPGRYGAESQAIMATFASYAAVAIENTRLYQESQEQALLFTVMLQVAEVSQSQPSLTPMLDTVTRLTSMLTGVKRCAVLVSEESTGSFQPAAAYGLDATQREVFDQVRIVPGQSLAFDALWLQEAPQMITDPGHDPRMAATSFAETGFESVFLLPLTAQRKVLGAMLVDCLGLSEMTLSPSFIDSRLSIIQGIARQTAIAIENIQLREAQQEEAYVSAALLQVAQAVTSLNNLDDILDTVVRIIPILIGIKSCALFLREGEPLAFRLTKAYGFPREVETALTERAYVPGDFGLLDQVCARNDLFTHVYGGQEDEMLPADLRASWMGGASGIARLLLSVPLAVQNEVLGAMILEEATGPIASRERRIEIITGIAHQAAIAIQNEQFQRERLDRERIDSELQLAHEIQQAFIPSNLPAPPGWEIAADWRAARLVAGDFYDLFDLPGGRLGIVIADVADKGMGAALFMALTRTLMRATAPETISPGATLARVNDLLVPDARSGMFVTAFYGVLSLESGTLVYAVGGHNLPLILRANTSQTTRLKKGGMALGVIEGLQFPEHSITMRSGDSLVCYTDGVTESFSTRNVIYGEKRLRQAMRRAQVGSARALLEDIESSVLSFVGEDVLSDDLTLVVLRRK
jgi:sigma-B regulation protein RsbU (phosphoserine phosphatase)